MLIRSDTRNDTEALAGKLSRSAGAAPALFAEVIAASPRLTLLRGQGKTHRLERLVASEAWSDAALELLNLEAPEWTVQRLCQTSGEWLCSLARFRDLPDWLDDCIEANHRAMPLAILGAVLELRMRQPAADWYKNRPLPQLGSGIADCTDYR
jgi:hypothetical protein